MVRICFSYMIRAWLPAVFRPLYLRLAYTHYEAENAVGLLALLLPLPQCWENRLYHQAHLYFGKSTEPKALGMLGKYSTMSHVPRAQYGLQSETLPHNTQKG